MSLVSLFDKSGIYPVEIIYLRFNPVLPSFVPLEQSPREGKRVELITFDQIISEQKQTTSICLSWFDTAEGEVVPASKSLPRKVLVIDVSLITNCLTAH